MRRMVRKGVAPVITAGAFLSEIPTISRHVAPCARQPRRGGEIPETRHRAVRPPEALGWFPPGGNGHGLN